MHPAGTAFQKPFSTGELELAGYEDAADTPGAAASPPAQAVRARGTPTRGAVYQKGLQTFVWKAEDDNDDRLQYDVLYRREGETGWKVLRRGLNDPILVWDTTSVPDGTYVIKVVASDTPSNSPGTALNGELESRAFDIDNTPPQIVVGTTVRPEGTGRSDVHGPRRAISRSAGRVLARRQSLARDLSEGRDPGFSVGGIRGHARERLDGEERHHPRHRRDEQCRDGCGHSRSRRQRNADRKVETAEVVVWEAARGPSASNQKRATSGSCRTVVCANSHTMFTATGFPPKRAGANRVPLAAFTRSSITPWS